MARPPLSAEQFLSSIAHTAPSIELMGQFKGLLYPLKVRCNVCDTKWTEKQAANLGRGFNRCPKCHGRRLNAGTGSNSANETRKQAGKLYVAYLKRHTKLRLVEPYKGTNENHSHKCDKGHVTQMKPYRVLRLHRHSCKLCNIHNSGRYSNIAIKWLTDVSRKRKINIRHAANGGEFCIHLDNGRWIFVDGYCEETNTVYEFHGDAYHGNPDIYQPHERTVRFSKLTASQLYKKTLKREKLIRSLGYRLVVMWESDYKAILSRRSKRRLAKLSDKSE